MVSEMSAGIDHPCKNSCSGWRQGYEKGKDEGKERLEAIKEERDSIKASLLNVRQEYIDQLTEARAEAEKYKNAWEVEKQEAARARKPWGLDEG